MAYTLQALIGNQGTFRDALPAGLRVVALDSKVEMVPLDGAALKAYSIPFLPLTDGGADLPAELLSLCVPLSAERPVAYVEAEFFGGDGTQACVLLHSGNVVSVSVSPSAINEALRWLDVGKGEAFDEFEAVGLGQHRETESWR